MANEIPSGRIFMLGSQGKDLQIMVQELQKTFSVCVLKSWASVLERFSPLVFIPKNDVLGCWLMSTTFT
jgi:hypothetical protein